MSDVTTPTPQGAPPPAAPPAPVAPEGGQPPAAPPAPVPTPPVGQPAPQGAPTGQPGDSQPPTGEAKFTQADLDRIAGQARAAERAKWQKQVQGVFGEGAPDDPAAALKQAQQQATVYQQQAQTAMAESLAAQAGIKPERVGMFVRLVDMGNALNGIDPSDLGAVRGAIKTAVDQAAAALPEFKGSALPASSGGDGQGGANPSLDQLIAAAEVKGDWKAAISLKRKRAEQRNGG